MSATVTMDERPAPPSDLSASWWHGKFWPGKVPAPAPHTWEGVGRRPVLQVRHLPVRRVAEALATCPDQVDAASLERWRALWDVADVDALQHDIDTVARPVDGYARKLLMSAWTNTVAGSHDVAAFDLYRLDDQASCADKRQWVLHAAEDARHVLALLDARVEFHVVVFRYVFRSVYPSDDGPGRLEAVLDEDRSERVLGSVQARRQRTNPYWTSAAWRAVAGRDTCQVKGLPQLCMTLADMARAGHSKAFLKGARSKSGTWVVDISCGPCQSALTAAVARGMGTSLLEFVTRGDSGDMLVQPFTPFLKEHRFFVVRGRVVASTPSDRALGPGDARRGRILDPRVAVLDVPADGPGEYDRGSATVVEDRALVAAMARGARGLARAMLADPEGANVPDCMVVDMGLAADGRVLPVEINSVSMAGLYAVDLDRYARSLRRRQDDPLLAAERVLVDKLQRAVATVRGGMWRPVTGDAPARVFTPKAGPDGSGPVWKQAEDVYVVETVPYGKPGEHVPPEILAERTRRLLDTVLESDP